MSINSGSAEIERDAESERAQLISTLGQLRENLKPTNVIDEVMAGAQINVSDISDRLWQTARANPIPAVLIGLGTAMLLGVGRQLTSKKATDLPAGTLNPGVADRLATPAPVSRTRLSSDRSDPSRLKTSGRVSFAETSVSEAVSKIAASADDLRRQASLGTKRVKFPAGASLNSVSRNDIMTQYSRSRDQVTNSIAKLLDDQPLVLAALGIAVGAAIGAAIPSSETESQLMGEASGSVKHAARELALEQYSHLKETAAQTIDEVKRSAADRGLSTENLAGLVQDVGSNVQAAAYGVGAQVAETVPHRD